MAMPATGIDPARALVMLQRLLEIPGADLKSALIHACDALADAFAADKVDAFLYDEPRDSLVAVGASTQPLSNLQKSLGLDVLPLSNAGRVVEVFQTGRLFRSGEVRADEGELVGIREGLKVESSLGVPLDLGSKRRGVVMLASLRRDFFSEADEGFVTSAAAWVGTLAHRAELMEEIGRNAVEQGRRSAADELVTVLAHDVRNYLAPISGRLYILRQLAESKGDQAAQGHADMALRGVTGLSKLVTNLLDVARIDRGLFDLDIEPVDLCEIATEAAGALSRAEHEIIVKSSATVVVAADRARLRQCLDNLLSNALGHSPRSAPVNVFIRTYAEDGKPWARLQVIDEGPGVPQEIMPHLFERFVSGRSKSGGVGLGLYLANRIAQAHGGRIAVASDPGKGSRFTLCLPEYQPPSEQTVTSGDRVAVPGGSRQA
jgi:two-component system, OmpR family, sensor kinase